MVELLTDAYILFIKRILIIECGKSIDQRIPKAEGDIERVKPGRQVLVPIIDREVITTGANDTEYNEGGFRITE